MAETIREFLVKIGYQVDGGSERRFEESMGRATLRAELLGRAIAQAAESIVRSATQIASAFDDIYYASQRTQASVQNLRALGYAVSQLGGSYQGALGAIESFGQKLRSNPGYASLVRSLGVSTESNGKMRDAVEIVRDLAKAVSQKPYYIQLQYMEALGIDERTFRALQSGELVRYMEEYRQKQRALGVDQERAAVIGRDLTQAWRSLNLTLTTMGEKLMMTVGPALTDFIKRLDDFIVRNQDTIVRVFTEFGRAIDLVATGFVKIVRAMEPLFTELDKLAREFSGEGALTVGMAAFAAWMATVWVAKILGAFTAVSLGFTALLTRLGPLGLAVLGGVAASEYAKTLPPAAPGSAPGFWDQNAPGWMGGNRVPDKRTFWQKVLPKWLGGKDREDPAAGIGAGQVPGLSPQAADDYANRLGKRESGNNYAQPGNQYGFVGRWQMGAAALADAGYVRKGTSNFGLRNPANWLGTGGISSLEDFLANKDGGQDAAFARFTAINYARLKAAGVITDGMSEEEIAGWLAAAHLKGVGGAIQLWRGVDNYDGNGTSASSYRNMMRGIRTGQKPAAPARPAPSSPYGGLPSLDSFKTIQDNAATTAAPAGAGGGAALQPAPGIAGAKVDISQRTEINVIGGSEPQATAAAVADSQRTVNGGLIRNVQGAVR